MSNNETDTITVRDVMTRDLPTAIPKRGSTRFFDHKTIYIVPTKRFATTLAETCGGCSIFFCGMPRVGGCGAGTNWREVNALVANEELRDAALTVQETNPWYAAMESCDGECDRVCSKKQTGEHGVGNQAIEHFLGNWAYENDLLVPRTWLPASNGKPVATVGCGYGGMTAAHYLMGLGYPVTGIDRATHLWGLALSQVPKHKSDNRFLPLFEQNMRQEGFQTELGVEAGVGEHTLDKLRSRFPGGVILNIGNNAPRWPRHIPGVMTLDSIYQGVVQLEHFRRRNDSDGSVEFPLDLTKVKKVVVFGPGYTSQDVLDEFTRANPDIELIQVIRKPDPGPRRHLYPDTPDGLDRARARQDDTRIIWNGTAGRFESTEIVANGVTPRATKAVIHRAGTTDTLEEITGKPGEILFVFAIGNEGLQVDPDSPFAFRSAITEQFIAAGGRLNPNGTIMVDRWGRTGVEGVYAGSEARIGPAYFARAIGSGREAAFELDSWQLRSPSSLLTLEPRPHQYS